MNNSTEAMSSMTQGIKKILEIIVLSKISLLMLLLVILVTANVVMRYVFHNPLVFSEELSRYSMIWLGLIGSSYAFVKNEHTAFTLIKERICNRVATTALVYDLALRSIVIIFATLVFIGGVILVQDNFSQLSAILGWKMGYVYLCCSHLVVSNFEKQWNEKNLSLSCVQVHH